MRCVLRSSARVRAPTRVATVSTTVNLVGESSRTTVSVPSPLELNASFVIGSKAAPSVRFPIGSVASTRPEPASSTIIFPLPHTENSTWFAVSMASPVGPSPGASGQRGPSASVLASKATTALESSRFTNTLPLPSTTANSGLPPRATLPTILPVAPSITVALPLPPFMVKTRCVTGS